MSEIYATTSWTADDVMERWKCSEDEAHAFLADHEREMQDWLTECGWDRLGYNVPFDERPDDEDEDEEDEVTDDHELEGR
jgi:hypothetical protein